MEKGGIFCKVAVSAAVFSIDKPYDYTVPPELTQVLRPGMRVLVPFGAGNRRTEGLVLALEPGRPPFEVPVTALFDADGRPIGAAPHATMAVSLPFARPLVPGSLLRRRRGQAGNEKT